jgi:hypothetical protein
MAQPAFTPRSKLPGRAAGAFRPGGAASAAQTPSVATPSPAAAPPHAPTPAAAAASSAASAASAQEQSAAAAYRGLVDLATSDDDLLAGCITPPASIKADWCAAPEEAASSGAAEAAMTAAATAMVGAEGQLEAAAAGAPAPRQVR